MSEKELEKQAEQEPNEKPEPEAGHGRGEEATDWQDRYVRLAAEFDNFRRRTNREKEDLLKYGNTQLLKALLPLLDDLDRTLAVAETSEPEALIKSLKLVHKNLNSTLEKQGVQTIDAMGQVFDTELHEAIASLPAQEAEKKGKVIEVIEKGYRYQERVIRYAKVITGE
ncbi:MAG: nucleotide exchange factor GrpE [Bacteroidetes bacterium]|jgi:molecular chaperone GrpE|nr:nucleotide exchange factor GrpE [Bacteroidota bacterium]